MKIEPGEKEYSQKQRPLRGETAQIEVAQSAKE